MNYKFHISKTNELSKFYIHYKEIENSKFITLNTYKTTIKNHKEGLWMSLFKLDPLC